MDNHTKELEYLLNNFWVIKEENPKIYFNIKNNLDYYKEFIRDKLGSKLIVNERFIKLEKIPSTPKSYMGIMSFNDKLEYTILFIVLLFLEDKPRLEQFILSNLTDFITTTATKLELNNIPDWNILHHRKCFVNVMKHLKELNIIKIVEEQNTFTEEKTAETLYETTGLSNYLIREFKNNINDYTNIDDYINDEFTNQDLSVGDIRRYKVYRHLLYELVSYSTDLKDYEIDYLRRFRSSISTEIQKYTNSELELSKSMAVLMFSDEDRQSFDFPNTKAITDITLLINQRILEFIDENQDLLNNSEILNISKEQFYRIIKDVKTENNFYLSKFYREMVSNNFIKEVINYMKEYDFIKEEENNFLIYPMVSKLVGYIPKEDMEQLSLFGGEENA